MAERTLDGKHALVTGGSRGIGRGIALKLAAAGAKVAVHYFQNKQAAEETLAGIRKAGSDGILLQADLRRMDEIERTFATVKREFAKLDIFVANARPEAPEFFAGPMEITPAQWDAAFDSQAKGFLLSARAAAALMPRLSEETSKDGTGYGRILAIVYHAGSVTGSLGPWVGMGSAKAAMESLVRYFAVALARRGITVNAISPGWTEDSVLNSLPAPVQSMIRGWHQRGWTPMGRLGTPEDIGNVAALLCSAQAAWITGQIISADGGSSLMNPEIPTEMQMG
jgi:NAD(P)-dependent dehydrogenase (short-subunit alcohol dehydrogenase family)